MLVIEAKDIRYVTGGKITALPETLEFKVDDDFDPETELEGKITNMTGWEVESFDWEWL